MYTEMGTIRVLIADDHHMVRMGIRDFLFLYSSSVRFIIDEADTVASAIEKARRSTYDVVLMDYGIPEGGGARATELILAGNPHVRVLGLSIYDEKAYVRRMVRAGARGYVLKSVEPDTLMQAIRTVMSGRRFYSNEIALQWIDAELADGSGPGDRLTEREREVLRLALTGLKSWEIAEKLFLSTHTINKHREHIREKLGVHGAVELVQAGRALGIGE